MANLAKILSDYDKHCLRIAQATSIDISEKHADKLRRIAEKEKEYIAWFEYYLVGYAKKPCAKFHKQIANAIISKKKIKALLRAYRSSAKSVHVTIGIPLYLYLVKRDLFFMLLIGETEPKAKALLAGIQAELQHNNRIINDYGKKFQHGDWADGNFMTTDGVRFMAIGFGQSPRGARQGADRPDYIAVDDIDNKKHVKNDTLMRDGVDFITEDVWGCFDADDNGTERFVYANNDFHKNSITSRLKQFFEQKIREAKEQKIEHEFYHLQVDAVKDIVNFEPAWKEKTSADYWRKKFQSMPYRSFMREYMNTHIEEGKVFKPEWIQETKILPYKKYDAICFYGDLSWGDEACHKSIVAVGKIGRQFHILHIFFRQSTRTAVARWLYDIYEDRNLQNADNIQYIIEGLFAMSEFVNDFDSEGDDRGYYIPVVASKRSKTDKLQRIEGMSDFFERRNMFFNEAEKDNADQILARDTLLAFEKGAKIPLDFLDALQGGITEVNQSTFIAQFEIKTTPRVRKYRY
ncbi:MAG: hypothetical protein FWC39_08035 [Bacteroidetes bacterium]|nr:hypothetical protein [Bacteroidota bacterium]